MKRQNVCEHHMEMLEKFQGSMVGFVKLNFFASKRERLCISESENLISLLSVQNKRLKT